jgi:hypothetical protein
LHPRTQGTLVCRWGVLALLMGLGRERAGTHDALLMARGCGVALQALASSVDDGHRNPRNLSAAYVDCCTRARARNRRRRASATRTLRLPSGGSVVLGGKARAAIDPALLQRIRCAMRRGCRTRAATLASKEQHRAPERGSC